MFIKPFFRNILFPVQGALLCILLATANQAHAQEKGIWKNKKCAVSLTYDDALNVHLDNVIPLLDALGLKGTFYVAPSFPALISRTAEWKAAAAKGHELGNHSLFHPCDGKRQGREWVKSDYDLSRYSVQRMTDEIKIDNFILKLIDNKSIRTFAYPCGDTMAGDASYVPQIRNEFAGARGVAGKMQSIDEIDRMDIGSYMINGQSGDELIALVKQALDNKALLVFLFHGVGGEHDLNVSLEAHKKLLQFLKENEKDVWIAPLADVAEYVKQAKRNK
jgi:peptidoglycan-N-acetylglucosamine deacetylase